MMVDIADTFNIVGVRVLKHSVILKNVSSFGKYVSDTESANRLSNKSVITDEFASETELALAKLYERPDVVLRLEQDEKISSHGEFY